MTVDPATTAYAPFVNDPEFLSEGTIPDQLAEFQPRFGIAWDVKSNSETVVRANAGLYYARNNMLSQAGSVTANGLQNQGAVRGLVTGSRARGASDADVAGARRDPAASGRPVSAVYRRSNDRVRLPQRENRDGERRARTGPGARLGGVFRLHLVKGRRFEPVSQYQHGRPRSAIQPAAERRLRPHEPRALAYRGATFAVRKRFSRGYQLEANYVLSKDMDTDSSERDPFTDRSFDLPLSDLDRLYAPSDRDIRHKFNLYAYGNLPAGINRQRSHPGALRAADHARGRRTRRTEQHPQGQRVLHIGLADHAAVQVRQRYQLIPTFEMFNTFNNENNINPLVTPALFNFDGFLRLGVGDPRQVQLSVKFLF